LLATNGDWSLLMSSGFGGGSRDAGVPRDAVTSPTKSQKSLVHRDSAVRGQAEMRRLATIATPTSWLLLATAAGGFSVPMTNLAIAHVSDVTDPSIGTSTRLFQSQNC
jgi:hypothetical protein